MIATQFYGTFTDHLPSVLPLLTIAAALLACSTTGQSSSRNNRRGRGPSSANRGGLRRVVGYEPELGRSNRPLAPPSPALAGATRRPEPRRTTAR